MTARFRDSSSARTSRRLDEPIKAGEAKVFFTLRLPGRYLVAADYMTAEGPQAEQFTVEVAGADDATAAGTGGGSRWTWTTDTPTRW
jgi:hypothetical protein